MYIQYYLTFLQDQQRSGNIIADAAFHIVHLVHICMNVDKLLKNHEIKHMEDFMLDDKYNIRMD